MSQDAKMSLDRLAEVHDMDDEETDSENKIRKLPDKKDIYINNLSYQYEGPRSPFAFKDVNCYIEENKITAIVGVKRERKNNPAENAPWVLSAGRRRNIDRRDMICQT